MFLIDLPAELPANHIREWLIPGMDTVQTINRMRDLVSLGKRDFEIRKLVSDLVWACQQPKDYYCYAEQAHNFCRDKIRYVFDPNGVELIERPRKILESRIADCDSIVVLAAALYENMGFPAQFVTIKADPRKPELYSHVYLRVKLPKQGWVGSDPTQPERPFGWEPKGFPEKTWPASKDAPEDKDTDKMAYLGYLGKRAGGRRSQGRYAPAGSIPGLETTPGVMVNSESEFRSEPALVVTNPEEMELTPFVGDPGLPTEMAHGEWYFVDANVDAINSPGSMEVKAVPQPGMSGLAEESGSALEVTVWGILTGNVYNELVQLRDGNKAKRDELDKRIAVVNAMPEGAAKTQAKGLIAQAENAIYQEYVNYRKARDAYNDFVVSAKTYTAGMYSPQTMSGLGAFPAIVATILGVYALAQLVGAIANALAAARGQAIQSRSFLDQLANLLEKGGKSVVDVGKGAMWLVGAAALGLGVYWLSQRARKPSGA
jgi:hypothetical protein